MKAVLKNYRQSPRKVRLLADLVRGKKVKDALNALQFIDKRAAEPFAKVLRSAEANAKDLGADTQKLIIKNVQVNKGTDSNGANTLKPDPIHYLGTFMDFLSITFSRSRKSS